MRLAHIFGMTLVPALILAMRSTTPEVEVAVVPTASAIVAAPPVVKKVKRFQTPPGLRSFMSRMSRTESNNRPGIISKYGMLGKYQFAPTTMRGILGSDVTPEEFLNDESLQDKAMLTLMRRNRRYLRDLINEFTGQTVHGVYVTEAGILAGAHLVGPVGVLAFFHPEEYDAITVDRNGTTVQHYMEKFADYKLVGL